VQVEYSSVKNFIASLIKNQTHDPDLMLRILTTLACLVD
jgi:hypothetical protein